MPRGRGRKESAAVAYLEDGELGDEGRVARGSVGSGHEGRLSATAQRVRFHDDSYLAREGCA